MWASDISVYVYFSCVQQLVDQTPESLAVPSHVSNQLRSGWDSSMMFTPNSLCTSLQVSHIISCDPENNAGNYLFWREDPPRAPHSKNVLLHPRDDLRDCFALLIPWGRKLILKYLNATCWWQTVEISENKTSIHVHFKYTFPNNQYSSYLIYWFNVLSNMFHIVKFSSKISAIQVKG